MKIFFIVLASIILTSCSQGQEQQSEETQKTSEQSQEEKTEVEVEVIAQKLPPEDFKNKMKELNGVIVDVRSKGETEAGMIKDAIHVSYHKENFKKQLLEQNPEQPIFVYCQSGGRSAKAFQILVNNGFQEVYELQGGMNAWNQQSFPTVKP